MNIAIIAAAGTGSRMASDRPKQFLQLAGSPIIFHTLKPFELCESIQEVIVVLPAEESAAFLALAGKQGLRKLARVVPGGSTRADSVKRGLAAIRSASLPGFSVFRAAIFTCSASVGERLIISWNCCCALRAKAVISIESSEMSFNISTRERK